MDRYRGPEGGGPDARRRDDGCPCPALGRGGAVRPRAHLAVAALPARPSAGALVASTLAAAVDPSLPARAAGVGGVFASGAAFTNAFATEFARIAPDAQLIEPAGGPLDGAVRLARLVAAGELPTAYPPFVW